VLENLISIVEAGGSSKTSMPRFDLFINSLDDFAAISEVYAGFFGDHHPTRVNIQVVDLPANAPFEVNMRALLED